MKNSNYENLKNEITSNELYNNLELYYSRLTEVYNSNKIKEGISIGSQLREIIQSILIKEGCQYVLLVPIETSINEYSENNFIAYNPYNKKSYSLVQSPQIQKEAAAVLLGSNFRLVDCYRGEKTNATHANIFQQIDVEFANKSEYEIRRIGKEIIETCFKKILNVDININDTFSYNELVKLYGTDNPNLGAGFEISFFENKYCIIIPDKLILEVKNMTNSINFCQILNNKLIFDKRIKINDIRNFRNKLIEKFNDKLDDKYYGYWVVDMPYAEFKNNVLMPTHHVMSKPKVVYSDCNFTFNGLSDSEVCSLQCNSFDLIICNKFHTVEVLGGDERINSFELQYSALKRLNYDVEQYAYLLETLRFNDMHEKKKLGGFAIGTERLAQFLIDCYDMKYVQLFPTNLPGGVLTHATSIEEMSMKRKKR